MATKTGNKGRYICKVGYLDIYAKDTLKSKKETTRNCAKGEVKSTVYNILHGKKVSLANLNSSYIDRFKTDIQEPNTNAKKVIDNFFTEFDFTQTFLTDAQKTAIEEKSTLNALQEAYDKYYESYIAFLKDLAIDKPISPSVDKVVDMRASTTQGITVQSSDSNLIPIINPNDISNFSNVQLSFDNFEEQINNNDK